MDQDRPTSPPDDGRAVAIAALKRALNQVEKAGEKVALTEGSYGVKLLIGIEGDLVAGPVVPEGDPKIVPDFTAEELVAALVAGKPRSQLKKTLSDAVAKIAESRRTGSSAALAKGELEGTAAAVVELIPGIARVRNVTKTVSRPARVGSVTGKPHVRITGACDEREVSITVD